jgi:hypothetical protein
MVRSPSRQMKSIEFMFSALRRVFTIDALRG